MNYEKEFDDALFEMEKNGLEYAKHRSLREQLERYGETLYSSLFLRAEAKTIEEKKHFAKSSGEFIAHNEGLDVAQEREHFFKVKYDRAISKFESLKCLCSQSTAMIKTTGGV